jgi:hypothetical protein
MDVNSSHTRNPLLGWDISATAKTGKGEKIVRAQILVNDFPQSDEQFDPPISNWQRQLTQQGEFPGDNKVQIVVTDDKGEDTDSVDSWST